MDKKKYIKNSKVIKAKENAIKLHDETNHTYDGQSYSVHLNLVYFYAIRFCHLLDKKYVITALSTAFTHDLIEDCRVTYNDLKDMLGYDIAEATFYLTNHRGKTRSERANDDYYKGIRSNVVSRFVKICDRLANVYYSKMVSGSMFDKYKLENENFVDQLYYKQFESMFVELENLFKNDDYC